MLSLTRTLKETWLFGKLQTVGTSEAELRTQAAKKRVVELLEEIKQLDGASGAEAELQGGAAADQGEAPGGAVQI